jgi:hypothetical protein
LASSSKARLFPFKTVITGLPWLRQKLKKGASQGTKDPGKKPFGRSHFPFAGANHFHV